MKTTCCIVGAGPGGMMLAYMLARKGVEVTLLEAQKDFDRDFRGDTLHPSIMENLEELGLVEKVLKLPHVKVREARSLVEGKDEFQIFSFDSLKGSTKYPYITLMPQDVFLDFMAKEAQAFKNFQLLMKTKATGLVSQEGKVTGVEVEGPKGKQNIFADLVVAADGRFSAMRKAAEIPLQKTGAPMDVLWFKLPKIEKDKKIPGVYAHVKPGKLAAQLDRGDHWQFGGIVPKGELSELHGKGIKDLQDRLIAILPEIFAERIRKLQDWKDIGVFKVDFGRVKQWYKPGLLLIGDAAHVMSPVGGVGINYAVQDAIVAANVLINPLLEKKVTEKHLKLVQKKRIWPTRVVQWFQGVAHKNFIKQALRPDKPLKAPFFARFAFVRRIVAKFIAFGLWKVRVGEGS
jgi:2-polyprenyl-6-methoxyphenol hydroxylase-like FAD-dependent oxidoreductase